MSIGSSKAVARGNRKARIYDVRRIILDVDHLKEWCDSHRLSVYFAARVKRIEVPREPRRAVNRARRTIGE